MLIIGAFLFSSPLSFSSFLLFRPSLPPYHPFLGAHIHQHTNESRLYSGVCTHWYASECGSQKTHEREPLASCSTVHIDVNFLFSDFSHLFERERERACAQQGKGRGWGREQADSSTEHRAWHGAQYHDAEITAWAKTKSQTLADWATEHPMNFWTLQTLFTHMHVRLLI